MTFNHYPIGWAHAMDTPFQWTKQVASHFGGTRNVLPLDSTKVERLDVSNRPSNIRGLNEFTYYDGMIRMPEGGSPDLKNKSFGISAVVEIPENGAEGVLMTQGGRFAGLGLYLLEGRP